MCYSWGRKADDPIYDANDEEEDGVQLKNEGKKKKLTKNIDRDQKEMEYFPFIAFIWRIRILVWLKSFLYSLRPILLVLKDKTNLRI